jgi:3-hydroxyacyl-[acyl-carrier-protein] dehydratase
VNSQSEIAYPIQLDLAAIEYYIPHRKPMLFTDSVTVLAHDHYTGTATFLADSFVFQGHFPAQPIVPGVMIIEAGAQVAAAGLRAGDMRARVAASGRVGVLMAIRKCFFRQPVLPGDRLAYEVRTRQIAEEIVNVTANVHCEGTLVATLEFTFGQIAEQNLPNVRPAQ